MSVAGRGLDRLRRTTEQGDTEMRWKMMRQLEDLDFADDIALIYSTPTRAQTKVERLEKNSEGTGLKVNISTKRRCLDPTLRDKIP